MGVNIKNNVSNLHGGDVKSFAKSINCKLNEVIDLSSNINFVKPKIKINFNTLDISSYPTYNAIYKKVAKLYGVKTSNCELFNGGSSAIFNLFSTLNLNHCTIYSPAYLEYKKACAMFGYKAHHINRLDLNQDIYQNIKKNSLVIFVNPSTPDGKYYNLKKLFKIWEQANATVLIDESFLDFTTFKSSLKYLKHYNKLYILKSMTKIYSSAGIRVGTLISSKKNIIKLKSTQPNWKLSQFDINYLIDAIDDRNFLAKSKKKNKQSKKYLLDILNNSSFCKKIYPSDVNFVLVNLGDITANKLQIFLKQYKIMIRDCSNFDGLDNSYVRIAVKSMKNLKVLAKALDEKY